MKFLRSHKYKRLFAIVLLGVIAANGQINNSDSQPAGSAKGQATQPLDPAKVALGKRLFFDTRLSADEWFSCSSCHDPNHGFSEARPISVGVLGKRGRRHTPTLLGRAFGESEFWDGRAGTLEEQVLQPITNPEEMGMTTLDAALNRLSGDRAYKGLNQESLAEALASYLRTVRSENTNYDLFISGWPVLNDTERQGLELFRGKARCSLCHTGSQLSDENFHNTGVAWRNGALQDDGRAAVTGMPCHKGAFKTPTLREVGRRGPFMHDGSLAALEDVVEFYDRGGNPNPYLDDKILPLHLSDLEKKALLAFLRTGFSGAVVEGKVEQPKPISQKDTRN